jgi:hypothetical protein
MNDSLFSEHVRTMRAAADPNRMRELLSAFEALYVAAREYDRTKKLDNSGQRFDCAMRFRNAFWAANAKERALVSLLEAAVNYATNEGAPSLTSIAGSWEILRVSAREYTAALDREVAR